MVENTDYNINYKMDGNFGGSEQFRITMKNSGNQVAAFPPDVAINIAEKSKRTSVGLIIDFIT